MWMVWSVQHLYLARLQVSFGLFSPKKGPVKRFVSPWEDELLGCKKFRSGKDCYRLVCMPNGNKNRQNREIWWQNAIPLMTHSLPTFPLSGIHDSDFWNIKSRIQGFHEMWLGVFVHTQFYPPPKKKEKKASCEEKINTVFWMICF